MLLTGPEQAPPAPAADFPEDIGEKMVGQVRNADRWYSAALPETKQDRAKADRKAPLVSIGSGMVEITPGDEARLRHPGVWFSKSGSGILPHSSQARRVADKLVGRPGLGPHLPRDEDHEGPLTWEDLYRVYKNTPHAPASTFLKYLVHRANNFEEYFDPEKGHVLDVSFQKLVQSGNAANKNSHVSIQDLHDWTVRHASLVMPGLLSERTRLHGEISRGIGLNVRDIRGEKYVALTRGLNDDIMNREHSLSSHSDKINTGFGTIMHHAWVPLKDIWYSFDLGPRYPSGEHGPENEWLISNKGVRYEAKEDDVRDILKHDVHGPMDLYDSTTDEEIAAIVGRAPNKSALAMEKYFEHPNAGPASYAAVMALPGKMPVHLVTKKMIPREAVLDYVKKNAKFMEVYLAASNPNLTADDLTYIFDTVTPQSREMVVETALRHPRMNSAALEKMWRAIHSEPGHNIESFAMFAESPLATQMILKEATEMAAGNEFMAITIVKNPHHTSEMAKTLLDEEARGATFEFLPSGEVRGTRKISSLARYAKVSPDIVDRWHEDNKKDVPYAADAIYNWARFNPNAEEYLPEAIRKGIVNSMIVLDRLDRDDLPSVSPEVQRAILQKFPYEGERNRELYARLIMKSGLAPDVIGALALMPGPGPKVWENQELTPEQLEEALPKGREFWDPASGTPRPEGAYERDSPLWHFKNAIEERRKYRERKLREHAIKPYPIELAKNDFWTTRYRSWLSKLGQRSGYYFPTTREHAINVLRDGYIVPDFTDELLEGKAVFAYRATEAFLEKWHRDHEPDGAVLYFETAADPEQHSDGRFCWTHLVPVSNAYVAAVDAPLEKAHGPLLFPRFGLGDDPRETMTIATPRQRKIAEKVGAGFWPSRSSGKAGAEQTIGEWIDTAHGVTMSRPDYSGTVSYARAGTVLHPEVRWEPPKIGGSKFVHGVLQHENTHRVFSRVKMKFGRDAGENLAQNILDSIPSDARHLRDAVEQYMQWRHHGNAIHEEKIASLVSYLNSPYYRDKFHKVKQHSPEQQRVFHTKMKQAYEHMRAAAETADQSWVSRIRPWERKEGLEKMRGPLVFPGLGLPDDRRETPVISTKGELEQKISSIVYSGMRGEGPSRSALLMKSNFMREKNPGLASGEPGSSVSYALDATGSQAHEDMHLMFNRVQEKYGYAGRLKLIANLVDALPTVQKKDLLKVADVFVGGVRNPANENHEEVLAYLLSYLNSEDTRKKVRQGLTEDMRSSLDKSLKKAHQLLVAIAGVVTPAWTQVERPWEYRTSTEMGHQVDMAETQGLPGRWARSTAWEPGYMEKAAWKPYLPPEKLEPHLEIISRLKWPNDREHSRGEYHVAHGAVGLKPSIAHDVWKESPHLQVKFPSLRDPNSFTREFKRNSHLYNAVANRHWLSLLRAFSGDEAKAAYAWQYGRTAAASQPPENVAADEYVQAFLDRKALKKDELSIEVSAVLQNWELDVARAMLGHDEEAAIALRAACFLTGRRVRPDMDKFLVAMRVYDGDRARSALAAVGLTDEQRNLRALAAVVELGEFELSKAEIEDPPPNIQSVQPGAPDAQDAAEAVQRAVTAGTLVPLKLTGKHSSGAMALRDPRTGSLMLLKPGSGKQSPAAGARDDKSSQSAREAAFWHVANAFGLGKYVPRADLLLVNAQEWAALQFLSGSDWATLDEKNRKVDGFAREVLTPYLRRGDCHRWAILDWVLGNVDRHGQNVMVGPGRSVALIDHGSAFAGKGFDPGHDDKSFIPYYLRVWAPHGISKMKPDERMKHLPRLDHSVDCSLRKWLLDVNPTVVQALMERYGIGPEGQKAVLDRLSNLQRYEGDSLSGYVDSLWAGAEVW